MFPRQLILRFCIVLIMAMALLGSSQQAVHSASNLVFTVDSFQDLDDFAPGNSVCSAGTPTGGPCTLRAAVTEANANIATPNQNIIIKLPAGEYDLTIPPDALNDNKTGDLNIEAFNSLNLNSITIEPLNGGKVVIKSTIEDRILSVGTNALVFIKILTLQNGQVLIDSDHQKGGGAINNEGTLDLDGVSLLNNMVRCSTSGSCVSLPYITGGAIFNNGTLTLTDSTLDGNEAEAASAIFNTLGSPGGNLTILYSTISNNVNWGQATIINYADLTILNSTFSGNRSGLEGGAASGIVNLNTLRMQSSTMANKGLVSGILNGATSVANIQDNIFKAEAEGTNCQINGVTYWKSFGYNIANDDSCQLTGLGDLSSVDPLLVGLGNWGGPTKTLALSGNSPAIDHRPGVCWTVLSQIMDDQRYWPRDDGKCDTGAVEYHPFWLYLPLISK
jgi:CSLREA domain-containing protein